MTTIIRPTQPRRRMRLLTAASAAVVLAVAVSTGLWQYDGGSSDSSERGSAAAPAAAASIPSVPASTSPQQAPRLYVVATEEAALDLRARFAALGQSDQPDEVRVLAQHEDADHLLVRLHELNRLRADNGLLPIHYVDLR
jgi:hypothetical protein